MARIGRDSAPQLSAKTFSSELLIHAVAFVDHARNKCRCGSKCEADLSLRKGQNDANNGACAPRERKTTPLEVTKFAV
jgi:hypothetical protein